MKNLKILFMLCIIMCVAIAASACKKAHNFGTDWTNDETNHWHSCSDEGCEEVSDKEVHTFGEGKVTTPATEAAEGVMTYACTVCGYEKTESISKLAHTHNLSKVAKVEASCTSSGAEAYYTCSGCDLIFSDAEGKNEIDAPKAIPAKNHDWEDATCEAPKTCINCDATEGEKLEHTPAAAVEENRVEATCGTAGSYDSVVKCGECGFEISREKKEIPATGNHVYSTEIERVPAKCEIDGYIVKKCQCGATEKTTLKAPGYHTYDNDDDMICNIEGCGYDRSCKHVNVKVLGAVAATCTSTGLTEGKQCEDCDSILVPQEVIEKAEHTSGNPIEENRNEASCLVDGSYEKVVKCSECGYEISRETVVINAPGQHTYDDDQDMICNNCPFDRSCKHTNTEVIPAVAATCTSTGLTAGEKCSDCGHVVVEPTVTEMAAHTPGEPKEENRVEPECEKAGSYDTVVYCSVCQTYEISRTPNTIPAIDHAYDDEFDAECNNGCGTVRDVPHSITVTGGSADKEYAMVGDTVTLTVGEAGENKAFSHWTLNGEKIEGNTFTMPNSEATVVAVFVDTVRKLDTPDNAEGKLVNRLDNGEIQIDRLSGNSMFDAGVDYILIHIYDSVDATESLGQMILYVTPGADCQGGKVMIGYVSTVDGSVKFDIVTGVKNNYWITGANSGHFFTVLKAAVGYEYTAGATYYLAMQAIAYKTPVVENGIEITYSDSDISVIGPNGMVQDASAPSTIHSVKVDGGLIEGQYTELQVGYGNSVTFTTEAKEGYSFAGWYLTDENGEATGNALSADWSLAYTIKGDTSIKAVFTQETIKLATPDNSASKLIYKEGTGSAAIALDRAGKLFVTGVDHVMFYVYTSPDANIEDYVARFVMYGYDGAATTECVATFATLDGVEYKYIRGGNGGYWITDTVYFYGMLADLIGYDYSYGQNYYFAAQRIAAEGTAYEDSDISVIGSTGFARDESKSNEKYTVTVENGLIDGSLTTVEAGYGVVLNITSNPFEDGEFGCWRYVTYAEDGTETLGAVASENSDFALTVTSSIILRSVALEGERIKLEAPDNSNNQMITFNGATTEYDRQKNEDGTKKTAFTTGVARIRYYMYVENTSGEKVLVGWFEIDREGYLYDYNGTKSSFATNGGKCYGELGNLYGIDGNWHNFIKRAYNQGATEKGLSSWNNNENHYFACQAITDNPDLYQNSEIGAMGTAWKSI